MKLLKDQVESLRYVNHLWPIVILRMYVSYFLFSSHYEMLSNNFREQPKLSALIDEHLYGSNAPEWIQSFFVNYVQENWVFSSSLMINLEWLLGFLFLVGFLNRPGAVVGMIYLYTVSFILSPVDAACALSIGVILFVLLLFGSGRVGGLDYFFYKRKRGLLW